MTISIDKAKYLKDYLIAFEFSDGTKRTIDFGGFLNKAKNPMTIKYLDKKHFQNFQLEYGDIMWNDFELCFPIWDLYEGKL